jgi:hypothetical protein
MCKAKESDRVKLAMIQIKVRVKAAVSVNEVEFLKKTRH